MEEWRKVRLGDLFERVTKKNTNLESENVLTISAQHGLVNQEDFFNKLVAGKNLRNYYLLKKGEFAYNKSYSAGYPMGATKMLEKYDNGIVSTLYICFKSKSNQVNKEFFKYYFESKQYYDELQKIAQEGARNHGLLNVNVEDYFNIEIKIPSIKEQEKIVNLLKKVDKSINLYEGLIENKKQLIKARFVELFDDCNKQTSIKESGLTISDGNYSSKYPRSEEFVENGIPFIRANNLKNGTVIDEDMYYITPEKHKILLKGHLKPNDVLITTRGNIGQVAIVPEKHNDSNINAQIVLLRDENSRFIPQYLLWALQTEEAKVQYLRLQTGTALKQLPVGRLEQVKIKEPPIEQQEQFVAFAKQTDKSKMLLEKQKENYMKLKKGLMQQLLTGKLRVKI